MAYLRRDWDNLQPHTAGVDEENKTDLLLERVDAADSIQNKISGFQDLNRGGPKRA